MSKKLSIFKGIDNGKYIALGAPPEIREKLVEYQKQRIGKLCEKFVEENIDNDKYFDFDFEKEFINDGEPKYRNTFLSDYEISKIKVYIDNLFYTYKAKLRHERIVNKIDIKENKKGNKI